MPAGAPDCSDRSASHLRADFAKALSPHLHPLLRLIEALPRKLPAANASLSAPVQPTIIRGSATATSASVEMDVWVSNGVREVRYLVTWYEGHAVISTQTLHSRLIGPFTSTPQTLTLTIGTDIDRLFDVVS